MSFPFPIGFVWAVFATIMIFASSLVAVTILIRRRRRLSVAAKSIDLEMDDSFCEGLEKPLLDLDPEFCEHVETR